MTSRERSGKLLKTELTVRGLAVWFGITQYSLIAEVAKKVLTERIY